MIVGFEKSLSFTWKAVAKKYSSIFSELLDILALNL
jgi:hypothetical protein